MRVAYLEGTLCRLDQKVNVVETFCLRTPQAIEHTEQGQRGQPLRGRRQVVHDPVFESYCKRRYLSRLVPRQVCDADRAPRLFQLARYAARELTAIEIIQAVVT